MDKRYPNLLGRYGIKTDQYGKAVCTFEGDPVIVRNNWSLGEVFTDARGVGYRVASDGSLRLVQAKENFRDRRARRREQARIRKQARKDGISG